MQVQSAILLDPAGRSHRPPCPAFYLTLPKQLSLNILSMTLSFTRGLKAHKLWEELHWGLPRAALCLTYPPCLCAFLEATGEGGSSNSLALESAGPGIAQCNQHPICQLEEKRQNRRIQRRLGIARKEMCSYFFTSGYLRFTPEEGRSPYFNLGRWVSDVLMVIGAEGHREHKVSKLDHSTCLLEH